MPRPCTCDRYIPGEPWVRGRDCARCWLWHNNPTSRAAFGESVGTVMTYPGKPSLTWACAVTTVGDAGTEWARVGVIAAGRRDQNVLARTLKSLADAGFPRPHLFVDGAKQGFGCAGVPVTYRYPAVLTWANWWLSLIELVARNPDADRYAMFQDDFVCAGNLRAYLDRCLYPPAGYWNLFTFPENEGAAGWQPAPLIGRDEHQEPPADLQAGRGAVALVFDRAAAMTIIASPHARRKMSDPRPEYRHKKADGGVVTAMNYAGYVEHVHTPSLVQHTGHVSSMGNGPWGEAPTFPGENFDLLQLLSGVTT